jgi:hypothetical protein
MDLERNKMCECGMDAPNSGRDQWQALVNKVMNLQAP